MNHGAVCHYDDPVSAYSQSQDCAPTWIVACNKEPKIVSARFGTQDLAWLCVQWRRQSYDRCPAVGKCSKCCQQDEQHVICNPTDTSLHLLYHKPECRNEWTQLACCLKKGCAGVFSAKSLAVLDEPETCSRLLVKESKRKQIFSLVHVNWLADLHNYCPWQLLANSLTAQTQPSVQAESLDDSICKDSGLRLWSFSIPVIPHSCSIDSRG